MNSVLVSLKLGELYYIQARNSENFSFSYNLLRAVGKSRLFSFLSKKDADEFLHLIILQILFNNPTFYNKIISLGSITIYWLKGFLVGFMEEFFLTKFFNCLVDEIK